ncbi:Serine/threonine-protein kinase PknG [Oceanobacillus picturae]|uniref:Serine/threonine-protein kinase PknG n=2 Tax=Oceanobacillus picturae TaxID=171693 RepID=W9BF49_9BACI|nr:Serine/threonine-protein kinase PknG [Oceanobacillus picturae]
MMKQDWKKHDSEVKPGMFIEGKWHKKKYLIKKKLGAGAIGSVYLCDVNGRPAALKISDNSTSMTVEVNVLKSLEKVQGTRLGPYLLDVDDWVSPLGAKYSFYVMEYLKGEPLGTFIQQQGKEWLGVFMLQLLEDLNKLHQSGWVFGDLKTENLMVIQTPPRLRWVDVGGTTQIGRAIKEYTEFYDRGYWGMGTRRAEPSYDLFAFVMVFLHVYYPKRFEKGANPEATLMRKLNEVKALTPYRHVLKKALMGKYTSSADMKRELIQLLQRVQQHKQTQTRSQSRKKMNSGKPVAIEIGGLTFLAVGYYLLSLLL